MTLAEDKPDDPLQRLWCAAIVATQDGSSGRMVCDVERLLAFVNERKSAIVRPECGERDPAAYLKRWTGDDGRPCVRVDLGVTHEAWLDAKNPTITPLYASPRSGCGDIPADCPGCGRPAGKNLVDHCGEDPCLMRSPRSATRTLPDDEIQAAFKVAELYFTIAEEVVGQDEVRRRFKERFGEELVSVRSTSGDSERLAAMTKATFSHVDGRDLLHELQPNGAHHIDILVRINGQDRCYEGDWLKRLTHARDGHNMGEYADNPKLKAHIESARSAGGSEAAQQAGQESGAVSASGKR